MNAPENSLTSSYSPCSNFMGAIYAALFEPFSFYEKLSNDWPRQSIHLLYASMIVIGISGMGVFLLAGGSQVEAFSFWRVIEAFASAFFGLTIWLLTALTFSALAYCFRSQGRLATLLILTGYAMLPWVLTGPLAMLRYALGIFGLVLYFVGLVALWFWTTILFLAAIQKTYSLSMDRVLLIGIVPVLILTLGLVWLFGGIGAIVTLFA